MTADMPDPLKVAHYRPCGGCGAASPDQRCIGCFHEFGGARAMQDAMAGGVRVKALEWAEVVQLRSDEDPTPEVVGHEAETAFGTFYVIVIGSSLFELDHAYEELGKFETERDVKAAAQADYERRILSALEPAGAQEGAYNPVRDLEPCLEARLAVTPESLDAFMKANPLPPEPSPAPEADTQGMSWGRAAREASARTPDFLVEAVNERLAKRKSAPEEGLAGRLRSEVAFWENAYNRRTGQAIEARSRAETAEASLAAARGEVELMREALAFYADDSRYEGANQRPVPGDPYTPVGASYRVDVTRDNGDIARAALGSGKGG